MQSYKIFVSSPGDVMLERRRVENVVSRLNGEFVGVARLETIRWETEFYQAHRTFQAQIPRSTECDLVVGILKWRLGTELPSDFDEKLADGRPYPSGTAYEILTAVETRRKGASLPDIFVFRFVASSPSVTVEDPNRARVEQDWQGLKAFFQEWFLTEQGHFKAAFNPYTSEDDFEAQLEQLLRKWVASKVAGGRVVRWPIEVKGSPFRGLAAFGAKHAPVFFGRSQDVRRAVDLWRDAGSRSAPYLLLVGASGAGKSSLARAGLLPRLTTPGVVKEVDFWRTAVMRPGDSPDGPFAAAAAALMQGAADLPKEEEGRGAALPEIAEGDSRTPAELGSVLRHVDAAAVKPIVNALTRVAASEHDREHYTRSVRCDLVLLVDQLDELFAASVSEDERTRFIDLLAALVATGRVWVVVTLRADFYARMLDQPGLKKLKEVGATYDLAPPGTVELAEIVRGPAEAAGLVYEKDALTGETLDARLLREAERPDMLPLVQLALSRLFEGREISDGEIRLPLKVYERLGGLKGIVEEAGETALAALGEEEAARLPRLLRQLAVFAHGQDGTAQGRGEMSALTIRAASLSQAAPDPAARRLVDALVAARLLTTSGTDAHPQVRLAHQRVLEDWGRARTIVTESAEFYRIRAEVDESRRKWEAGQRRSELLLPRGLPLAEAESIIAKHADELAAETRVYVKASRARANRGQAIGWAAAAAFAFLAVGAGIAAKLAMDQRVAADAARLVANQERTRAEDQRNQAVLTQSLMLATLANQRTGAGDVSAAVMLALEALEQRYAPEVEAALFNARQHLRETAVLAGHEEQINTAYFSGDGRWILTASNDRTARIWDARTGNPTAVLAGHIRGVNNAVFSADGGRVATASDDKTARIWNAQTGKAIAVLAGHQAEVVSVALSADGRWALTASKDKTARIWDTATGKETAALSGHTEALTRADFSPDGRLAVTTAADKTARLWDVASGKLVAALSGHTNDVWRAAFSSDNKRIATASLDGSARIWDAATGKLVTTLSGHTWRVYMAAFRPDGRRVVTASYDQTARIHDSQNGRTIAVLSGHEGPVMTAIFSPDGRRVLTASADGTARIWDAETGRSINVFAGHTDWMFAAAFSPDGLQVVTAGRDTTARIWASAKDEAIAVLPGLKTGRVYRAAIDPSGRRVATPSSDKTARVWDVATGNAVAVLSGHEGSVASISFDPDGGRVVTASEDRSARIWSSETGKLERVLSGHEKGVVAAAFSPDGRRVGTGSVDQTARIWDSATGETLVVLKGHDGPIIKVAFSPDGRRVATASLDKTARLWDAATGRAIEIFPHNMQVWSTAFSPDGRRLVTATDKAWIWDIESAKLAATFAGHAERVLDTAFSPDGRRLATASLDGTARIWDLQTGKQISTLLGHTDQIWSIGFSSDGRRISTAANDGSVRVWQFFPNVETLAEDARRTVPRCLAPDQRSELFLEPRPPAWCIAMEKWPFHTAKWKQWQADQFAGKNPPLPENKDALGYVTRGKNYDDQNDYDRAIAAYDEAIRLDPAFPAAYYQRGIAYASKRELDRAIADYTQAIELDPAYARAYTLRGIAYSDLKNYDRAIADFDESIRLEPKLYAVFAYRGRGEAYLIKGDFNHAIADFNEAIALDPTFARTYSSRGRAYFNLKDHDRAIADYGESIRLDPKSPATYLDRGVVYFDKGDYDRAIVDYGEAITLDPKYVLAYSNRGDAYHRKKDYDRAIADYTAAVTLDPKYVRAYNGRGNVYYDKDDYYHAILDFSQAITLDPKFVAAYLNRGNAYYDDGDYDRALADYGQAVALDSKYVRAWYGRGNAYRQKREYDRAIADYTEAVRLDPEYARAYNGRGAAYANKRDYDRAIADYSEAIRIDPKFASAYVNRGISYGRKNELDHAIADYGKAIELDPQYVDAYNRRGNAYRERKDYNLAVADFDQALSLVTALAEQSRNDPRQQKDLQSKSRTIASLAYDLVRSRNFSKALAAADYAISLAPAPIWFYTNRAHALMLLDRTEEARSVYLQYRGTQRAQGDKSWATVVLEDFAELRDIGLAHPLMDEIEQTLGAGR
jgi:WD40 repeat protein/tetratricopeptide (TPR) repeat protein